MTAWTWFGCAVAVLLLSSLGGGALFVLLGERAYRRGVLAGQHQAELAHGDWHPAVLGLSWNRPEVPRSRRRSPDHQMVARVITKTHERDPLPH